MQRKKKLQWKHIIGILKGTITFIPACIAKIFIKNIWLIEEDDNEARDNGFWLYKYIKQQHPEQKCYYVLNKTSADYEKVKSLGKVIKPHSFSHWFWYIVASKNITTQTGGKPCPAFLNLMERKGLFKTKTYFLQHGITKDKIKWLYAKYNKFRLLLTAANPENDFIKANFGYPENVVQMLGFPRFDGLHDDITQKDMILVMPTWRNYINNAGCVVDGAIGVDAQNFLESDYFKYWNDFLNSSKLDEFLQDNKKTLYFYPHRNMQPFIDNFKTSSKNIIIAKRSNEDVQTLLKKCSMIITDYSSVIFDVLYQYKPVICYQFDYDTFRKGQYEEGYFDYKKTKLLSRVENIDELIKELVKLKKNDYKLTKDIIDEINKFFELRDNRNCERVFNWIKDN